MRIPCRTGSAAPAVLALLMLGLLAACSQPKGEVTSLASAQAAWDATVERAVPDPTRAARAKALGREMAAVQQAMAQDLAALNAQAITLNSDPRTTAEEIRRVSLAFAEQRQRAYAQYRDLVFALRAEVSEAEWKVLMKK